MLGAATPAPQAKPWVSLEPGWRVLAGPNGNGIAVEYQEWPKKCKCADAFSAIAPNASPLGNVGETIAIRLRGTGVDTPPCEAKCKTWVDSDGRLRILREWMDGG